MVMMRVCQLSQGLHTTHDLNINHLRIGFCHLGLHEYSAQTEMNTSKFRLRVNMQFSKKISKPSLN